MAWPAVSLLGLPSATARERWFSTVRTGPRERIPAAAAEPKIGMNELFHRFAQRASAAVGSPLAFALAVIAIIVWGLTGPAVGFSTTWQLVINTGTTIVTFLIVFLIQNTQNRESRAVQLKLDELISVSSGSDRLIAVEDMSDEQAKALLKRFHTLASRVSEE